MYSYPSIRYNYSHMNVLIVGGSSGLGLQVANSFSKTHDQIIITGRNNQGVYFAKFKTQVKILSAYSCFEGIA